VHMLQMTPGMQRLTADGYQLIYNTTEQTGSMENARGKNGKRYFYAKHMEFYPEKVVLYDGWQSECGAEKPHYRMSAKIIELFRTRMVIHKARYYLGSVCVYGREMVIKEYDDIEDNIHFTAEEVACPKTEMPEDVQDFLIHAITVCPHGVFRMIHEMPDVVETSNNLSAIKMDGNAVVVLCLTRSSVESRKEELKQMIQSTFAMAGAEVEFSGAYPGWKPNLNSRILGVMQDIYKKEFGKDARIITIHAGLECGIIGRNYPGMDMISFGPTIRHPHSPDERVNIATVQKFYDFLLATLKAL